MNTAKIIAITKPINLNKNGDEIYDVGKETVMRIGDFVAYVARVSNPANQNNTLTSSRLLKYLAKHKHWSPFEMVNIVMEINTTRDIGRQILRHRSFSFQEFSQRYADPTSMEFVTREARLQDNKNRQNSIETNDNTLQEIWEQSQKRIISDAQNVYNWAIQQGIAKEQARAVLPEGLTPTRMYMNGTLRSWIHYCQLRMGEETQKEHREIAIDAWTQIIQYFPDLEELQFDNKEKE